MSRRNIRVRKGQAPKSYPFGISQTISGRKRAGQSSSRRVPMSPDKKRLVGR